MLENLRRVGKVAVLLALLCRFGNAASEPPVFVTFWFDTEDYILPAADDAAKRLAEIFTGQGVRATFKIVGEKARALERRRRYDVIRALSRHDIGFHTDFHSVHPTPAEYESRLGWESGVREFLRREGPGERDLRRIFGVVPACYGQPGSSWAPQSYPALRTWGIGLYLDETPHVGLEGKPFRYCGVLNALNLGRHVTRAELGSEEELEAGCRRFDEVLSKTRAEGGGLISIYYHPCEWVHLRFWDAVNFEKGANPPRAEWKKPPARTPADTDKRFSLFAKYLAHVRTRPGVKLVTAREISTLYADRAYTRPFTRSEIGRIARVFSKGEVEFLVLGDRSVSAAEGLFLLLEAVDRFADEGAVPENLKAHYLDGPAEPAVKTTREGSFSWDRWVEACRDYLNAASALGRMPPVAWVGGKALSVEDFAVSVGSIVTRLFQEGKDVTTDKFPVGQGELKAARYVADDGPKLWGWIIFPPGFRAARMMELAKRQAWTLKPAVFPPGLRR